MRYKGDYYRFVPMLDFHAGLDIMRNPTYLFHTNDFIERARNARDLLEVDKKE